MTVVDRSQTKLLAESAQTTERPVSRGSLTLVLGRALLASYTIKELCCQAEAQNSHILALSLVLLASLHPKCVDP